MSATGYLQVHAYTSNAQIPLQDTAVTITDKSGAAIAMRLTNKSGLLDLPIGITVPDLSASQAPSTGIIPFSVVNLYARKNGYEEITVNDVQIFADTVTLQNLELIPLSEYPQNRTKSELFETTPQNL